jgi:hypothetical protein
MRSEHFARIFAWMGPSTGEIIILNPGGPPPLFADTRLYTRISLTSLDVLLLRAPHDATSSPKTRWAV